MNRYLWFWSALLLWFGLCYIIVLVIGSQTEVNQSCLMMCRSLAWLVKGCEWGESVSHCRGVSHPEKGRVSVQGNLRHPLSLDCCTKHTHICFSIIGRDFFYWFLFFYPKIFSQPDLTLTETFFKISIKTLFSMFIRLFSMWGPLSDGWLQVLLSLWDIWFTQSRHNLTDPHIHLHTHPTSARRNR